ncbi:hypothetical protein HDV00_010838 [Rhizophlyctis rosea]|nr:hypothetical protein HDV00_010838 [Rhizophlyctis rosea]
MSYQAAKTLKSTFETLSEDDKTALFNAKRATKAKLTSHNGVVQDASTPAKEKQKELKAAERAAEKELKAAERAAERERKVAEKAAEKDRKAAERKAEKDRKEAEKKSSHEAEEFKKAQSQKSLMGFFTPVKKEERKKDVEIGIWTTQSESISGRRPWGRDRALDYEVDSADEWEEDEPGEELKSEDEEEEEDDAGFQEEEDPGWLVPHGYLSDDEGGEKDDDDMGDGERELEAPRRRMLEPLVPIIIGPTFEDEFADMSMHPLAQYRLVTLTNKPSDPFQPPIRTTDSPITKPKTPGSRKSTFPDDLLAVLITHIKGSNASISKLVEDFRSKYPDLKKATVEQKIREIAVRDKKDGDSKACWHLKADVASSAAASGSPSSAPPSSLFVSPSATPKPKTKRQSTSTTSDRSVTPRNNSEIPPEQNSIMAYLSPSRPSSQSQVQTTGSVAESENLTGTVSNERGEVFTRLELKSRQSVTNPDECLSEMNLLVDDQAKSLADAPEGLIEQLINATVNSVRSDLQSRCFRFLGNHASYLIGKMRGGDNAEGGIFEAKWKSFISHSSLFEGIRSCVQERDGSDSRTGRVKNALRLLCFFVNCADENIIRDATQIGCSLVPAILQILRDAPPPEDAGYCCVLLHSAMDTYDGDVAAWRDIVDVVREQLGKSEWQEHPNQPPKDKWTGVKKYCLKILGKIIARGNMPAEVSAKLHTDISRLFGQSSVDKVLKDAAELCLSQLRPLGTEQSGNELSPL